MKFLTKHHLALSLLIALGIPGAHSAEVLIAREGKASSVILVPQHATPGVGPRGSTATVEGAANDLRQYIKRISGAELEVRILAPEALDRVVKEISARGDTAIVLGSLATPSLPRGKEIRETLKAPDGFVIHAAPSLIAIDGGGARGTEIGVHALLEQVGVRWFFPGELGTVIPESATMSVKSQNTFEKPSFAARQFQLQGGDEWLRFQRTGGRYFSGAHGIRLPKGIDFATHPEIYALVKGKRSGPQMCVSNPNTLKFTVERMRQFFKETPDAYWYGMGPEDKAGFCECEGCKALDGNDWDAFSGEPSMTDRYLWFFNQVLNEVKDEYPDKKLAFYIYHTYMRPPVRIKPHPNIIGAIAPIALCRIHGMGNPICPERSYLKDLIAEWKQRMEIVYERGYWFNLADPGMWFVQTDRLKDEISSYHRYGIEGFRTECIGNWAVEGPSLYLAGRLMWNANADTDALLRDYCEKLFGPAAKSMEAYFALINKRLRDSDYHTGSSFNILQFYPTEARQQLQRQIREAEGATSGTPYAARVALFSKGCAYANAFAEMLEAQGRHDWETAYHRLQSIDQLRDDLTKNYASPMLNPKAAKSYLDRFFRLPVEQGWAKASQNTGMAPLSNTWSFLTDPTGMGESIGYYREGPIGGNWQRIQTANSPWSDQGLRYYKGLAWYRQEVELPESLAGKRLFIWFGGVDESARVWINGKPIGISPRSAFAPFELDATAAIQPGKNTVAVCVANQRVDELGCGGITAPVFLYAPSGGEAAKLENIRPLGETFP